jgi:hypothetical protein
LVGRRERFKFDKVTAVSTTGFSGGAKLFAAEKGIELRRVTDSTPQALRDWLGLETLSMTKVEAHVSGSISTFFLWRRDWRYCAVVAIERATFLAPS